MRLRAQRAGLREVSDLRPGHEDVVGAATECLGGREPSHVFDRRIPETDDPVPFDEYDTVGDMLDYEGGSRAFLCLAVEARVVDRDGCAPRQVHGEVEIVLVVEPSRICRDKHERAEGSAGGGQWDDHRRLHPELVQDPVVLRILRRRDEELVRDRSVERGLTGPNDARGSFRLVRLRGVELLRPLSPDCLGRILVHDLEPSEPAVVFEDVDGIPVCEVRNEERGELGEGRLVVERRGEPLARFREHRQSRADGLGCRSRTLALRHVGDHDPDSDRLVGHGPHRVVADERVAGLARLAGKLAVRVLVEDRLSGLEDLAVERLDLVRQLVPVDVPECPAEVFVRREAVHPGQRLVHADVAKGRVHERHADWSRRENGVEDGERLARLQPRGIRSPEEQRVVDRDRGVTREIQCGRELSLTVTTPALREDEGDRAESPISRDERHAQRGLEAEHLQDLAQFRPGGDRIGDQLLRDLAEELRLERADDIRYAVGGVRVGGILLGQLVRPSHLVRIDVRNGQALDRAVPRDHVDCAPVGEPGHG